MNSKSTSGEVSDGNEEHVIRDEKAKEAGQPCRAMGSDTANPGGPEGGTLSQRGLFSSLKIQWNLSCYVLDLLENCHPSFFPFSPFWKENVYPMLILPLRFGNT